MRLPLVGILLFAVLLVFGQKLAVTIDDAPFGASFGMQDAEKVQVFSKLLQALEKYQVKATFFITSGNLTDGNKAILDMAKAAGHQFGNHTHLHLNLNNVTWEEYTADIDQCAELAKPWINSNYFRYSYLRRGNTAEKRAKVLEHLVGLKLRVAPVTIDNNEWVYNREYSRARSARDSSEMTRQLNEYLKHMSEFSERYREKGVELMNREIPHILLIHVNPLNCDHLETLLDQYSAEGWEFVSLDEVMKDQFYQLSEHYIGPHGISQLDRVKLSQISPK